MRRQAPVSHNLMDASGRSCKCSSRAFVSMRRTTRANHPVDIPLLAVPHVLLHVRLACGASSTFCIVVCCVPLLPGFVLGLVAFFSTSQKQRRRPEVRCKPTRQQDGA